METPVEVSMKVQRVSGVLSRESIWNVNYIRGCGTYQIENIMFPCIS